MCRLRGSIRADLVRFAAPSIAYVSAPGLPCRCGSTRTARLHSSARPFDLEVVLAIASYPRNPAGSFFSSVMAPDRQIHSVTHMRLCLPIRCVTHMSAVLMCRLRGSIRADLVRFAAPAIASYPRNPAGSSFTSVMAPDRLIHCVMHMRLCLPIRSVTHLSAVLMCRLRGSIRADLACFAAPAIASNPRNPAGSSFSSVMAPDRPIHRITHMRICLP